MKKVSKNWMWKAVEVRHNFVKDLHQTGTTQEYE